MAKVLALALLLIAVAASAAVLSINSYRKRFQRFETTLRSVFTDNSEYTFVLVDAEPRVSNMDLSVLLEHLDITRVTEEIGVASSLDAYQIVVCRGKVQPPWVAVSRTSMMYFDGRVTWFIELRDDRAYRILMAKIPWSRAELIEAGWSPQHLSEYLSD